MTWARHVPRVGRREVNTEFWWEYLRERTSLKGLDLYEKIILKLILKKYIGKVWTRFVLVQICEKLQFFLKINEIWIP